MSAVNLSPPRPFVQTPSEPTFPCRAGIRPIPKSTQRALYIVSPRTGKEISFSDGWFRDLPAGMLAKVQNATSRGETVVRFTRAELAAAAAICKRINAQPAMHKASRWGRGG